MKNIVKGIINKLNYHDIDVFETDGKLFVYAQDYDISIIAKDINQKLQEYNVILVGHTPKMATIQPLTS